MNLLPFKVSNSLKNQKISLLSLVTKNCNLDRDVAVKRFCKLKNVSVGSYSYIANNTQIINCTIGRYCSIGPFVKIGLGKHPVSRFSTSPIFYTPKNPLNIKIVEEIDFNEFETIQIGNDVWIGANAIVLDGISIGNGVIIAAGAVVTKDVPDYSIVAGVPAKVIKYRFNENTINNLNISKWWEKNIEFLTKYRKDYRNLDDFLASINKNVKTDKE